MEKLHRLCPVCDQFHINILFKFKYQFPEHYNMDPVQYICMCQNCGFIYNLEENNYSHLEEHSKENNRYEGVTAAFYGNALDYILKHIPKSSTILDAGCGQGFLLSELKKNQYSKLHALDPSQSCINKINQQGISGLRGSVYDNIPEYENYFDVIVFTNVIEHIANPGLAVVNFRKWLKPEGILYIEAPNAEIYSRDFETLSILFCAEHINHFNTYFLNLLFYKNGFKNIFNHEYSYALEAIYKKSNLTQGDKIVKDLSLKTSILCAYDKIKEQMQTTKDILSSHKGEKIAIWGMTHQFMLMYPECFQDVDISFIVDIDKSKHGLQIDSIVVYSPDVLHNFDGSIAVMDNSSKNSILNSIKEHSYKNKVICLWH